MHRVKQCGHLGVRRAFSCARLLGFVAVLSGAFCRAEPPDQDYLVDVWNVDHGLPQGSVMHVAQTPDGYLWISTFWQGIARFDGVRFVSYTPVNTPELPDQEGWRLMVGSRGTLWIASLQGSLTSYRDGRFTLAFKRQWRLKALLHETPAHVIFSTYDGKLVRGPATPGQPGTWEVFQPPDSSAESQFAAGTDGTVWHLRRGRPLARWRGAEFETPATPPELRGRRMRALATDPAGRVWLGTDMELAMWDGYRFLNMTPANGETNLAVMQMAFAQDASLWVEANGRLRKCRDRIWSVEARDWTGDFGPTGDPLLMNCDADGGVWFTHVGDGMIHVAPDGTVRKLTAESGLANNLTRCWLQDREGNVWTGSERGGLMRIRKRDFHVLGKSHGLTDPGITSVAEDADGALWCGSLNGMVYRWKEGQCTEFTLPMKGGRTRCVTVFPGLDRLWIGTSGNGVLERQGDEFKHVLESSQIGVVARTTLADKQGRLWIGNERELYCWDGQTRHSLPIHALALAEGQDGAIWAGDSEGALCRISPRHIPPPSAPDTPAGTENPFQVETFSPSDHHPPCRIWGLLAQPDGTVWLATDGAGLLQFRDGRFIRFTTAHGLPSDTIFQVIDDAQGRLWLGTRSGLASAEKSAFEQCTQGRMPRVPFQVYGRHDGLHALELCSGYQPACWRGKDGRLWFATANGVVFVQPANLRVNLLPPPVVLEQVKVDGKSLDLPAAATTSQPAAAGKSQSSRPIRLSPGRHFVEIQFTGLSLTAPDKVRFRWRLEGLEPDWTHGGADVRRAVYNPVLPGEYRFRVQACNNDGVWNETGATLAFIVPPNWWQLWWVRGLGLIVGATSLGLGVRRWSHRRLTRRLERLEQQQALERERLRIARDLHDDLGATVTQVGLMVEELAHTPPLADDWRAHISKVSTRVRRLARDLDAVVWSVNPGNDSLDSLAAYLSHYFLETLRHSAIRSRLQIQEAIPALPINPEIRHHVFLIFKEAINNIVKHSRAKEATLEICIQANQFEAQVRDDGQGFDPLAAAGSRRNGLRNMRTRAEELGCAFELSSAPGAGTTLRLTLNPQSSTLNSPCASPSP